MQKTAAEVMSTDVVTVQPTTTIAELARLFVETGYGTFPVVDEAGAVYGVVSESDLLRQKQPVHIPRVTALFDWVFYLESEAKFQEEVQRITADTVGDICTKEVISCGPETPVSEIATLMTRDRIHLVPVMEDGKLAGVVARVDLLRGMVN